MRSKGGNILMRASFSTIVTNNTMKCNGVLQKCDTSAIELTQKSNSKQDRHYFKKSQTTTDYLHQNQKVSVIFYKKIQKTCWTIEARASKSAFFQSDGQP